jgi:hypothetical protein
LYQCDDLAFFQIRQASAYPARSLWQFCGWLKITRQAIGKNFTFAGCQPGIVNLNCAMPAAFTY